MWCALHGYFSIIEILLIFKQFLFIFSVFILNSPIHRLYCELTWLTDWKQKVFWLAKQITSQKAVTKIGLIFQKTQFSDILHLKPLTVHLNHYFSYECRYRRDWLCCQNKWIWFHHLQNESALNIWKPNYICVQCEQGHGRFLQMLSSRHLDSLSEVMYSSSVSHLSHFLSPLSPSALRLHILISLSWQESH